MGQKILRFGKLNPEGDLQEGGKAKNLQKAISGQEEYCRGKCFQMCDKKNWRNEIIIKATPTGTKCIHAFATGAQKLEVKVHALSGKRGCETINIKKTKNTAKMVEENSGNSPIVIISSVTDRICVRVK